MTFDEFMSNYEAVRVAGESRIDLCKDTINPKTFESLLFLSIKTNLIIDYLGSENARLTKIEEQIAILQRDNDRRIETLT